MRKGVITMLQLISMFILGFVFAGCLMALLVIHNLFKEDDRLEEMSRWYEEEYPDDEIR
jgi:hypothetical protein